LAANTLEEISRSLLLYVPQLPYPLAQQFIRDRYRRILDRRNWSATRAEAEFLLNAEKSAGTVEIVRGTDTVVGTSTAFASTDVGRQFKVGTGSPVYTVADVDVGAQALTLDRICGVASATGLSYRIVDAYVSPPADFLQFLVVSDPLQGWRLRHWITAEELMAMDPQRTFFGQPYVIADRMFNSAGTPQFEAWPYSTAARSLYYLYIKRPADLLEPDDTPIWPLRSDAIVAGALADVARWPGTAERPNLYFARPDYWKSYELEFEDKMIELERRDEDVYMTMLQTYPWNNYPLAPLSASFIQTHAI
jgi:hypothetical protein